MVRNYRGLYDKYVEKNGYAADIQAAAEVLSEEVFLISRIISTIQQEEGRTLRKVANRLGLGNLYSYNKHLEEGLANEKDVLRNLTTLGIVLHTQHVELTGVYKDLLELYP